ncbi:MAG: antibiotic biosynthesis monooxygenase [Thermoleophilia bacterium]|nr:antibiotic biosynthesis monooxygenase [Thermoleophilia bacterium]
MAEVVVVARFRAKKGRGDEAIALLRTVIGPTHGERGCRLFALHRATDDPDHLVLVERWDSREDLDAHLQAPHVQSFRQAAGLVMEAPPEITILDPVPEGDPAKGAFAG